MKIKSLTVLVVLCCLFANSSFAQSCDKESLGNCLYNSGVTCRADLAGCSTNRSEGLSVGDVEDAAIAQCCRFTGKSKKKKSKECFKKIEAGLAISRKTAGPLKAFVGEARDAVIATRKAGCSTGSNT